MAGLRCMGGVSGCRRARPGWACWEKIVVGVVFFRIFWPGGAAGGGSGAAGGASAGADSGSTGFCSGAARVVSDGAGVGSGADGIGCAAAGDGSVAAADCFRPRSGEFCLVFLRPGRGVRGFLRPRRGGWGPGLGGEGCFAGAVVPAGGCRGASSGRGGWCPKVIRNSVKQEKIRKNSGTTAVGDAGRREIALTWLTQTWCGFFRSTLRTGCRKVLLALAPA